MQDESIKEVRENSKFSSQNQPTTDNEELNQILTILFDQYKAVYRLRSGEKKNSLKISAQAGQDLENYKNWLSTAHQIFRESSRENVSLTFASEWVLDNYYIIRQTLRQIEEDLPSGFYQQLPRLSDGVLQGYPRIYALARTILSNQNLLINPETLQTILIQFQKGATLTVGEVWAFPIFLRYSLIEFLSQALLIIINPTKKPSLPNILPLPPGIPNPIPDIVSDPRETTVSNSVANIILSLRTISEQNWKDFFEKVSCLERTLRAEAAGIYERMDFETRDQYRNEIEKLALEMQMDECELAEKLVNLAKTGNLSRKGTSFLDDKSRGKLDPEADLLINSKVNLVHEKVTIEHIDRKSVV